MAVGQALIAVPETKDRFNTVVIVKPHDKAANHIVQARAQSPTCDNTTLEFGGVKVDLLSGAGHLKAGRFFSGTHIRSDLFDSMMIEYTVLFMDKLSRLHG